jgi:hypothetical protein
MITISGFLNALSRTLGGNDCIYSSSSAIIMLEGHTVSINNNHNCDSIKFKEDHPTTIYTQLQDVYTAEIKKIINLPVATRP